LHPFRQIEGRQAQFTETDSGQIILVPAYLHDVFDYVKTEQARRKRIKIAVA